MHDPFEVFTAEQIAEHLQINITLARRLLREGEITSIKVGREYRTTRKDLEEFLSRGATRKEDSQK